MPRKKDDTWLTGQEASVILTENSGHPVSANYVRILAIKGLIRSRARDGRTNEYHEGDVRDYRVEPKYKKDRQKEEVA
jgi:hypothetical protein